MTTVVETVSGKIKGVQADGLAIFKGIPYAAAPVGDRRFKPPVPPQTWSGEFDATRFGPEAIQGPDAMELLIGIQEYALPKSEDCLHLNVWTPGTDNAGRPVMVWIHGGGFTTGSGAKSIYDGSSLAKRGDVVVVTINYRLGILGFLSHPCLKDEETGIWGNWGLLDQIAALEWVRDNIESFGGDPGDVTIFGESAGATSVGLLMVAPKAKGLFKRVISQSCAPMTFTPEQAIDYAEKHLKKLDCEIGDLDKLRNIDVKTILQHQNTIDAMRHFELWPVTDGKVLPHDALDAVDMGLTEGVDLLVGCNRDEAKLFLLFDPRRNKLDDANLLRRLEKVLPGAHSSGKSNGARILEVYREARAQRGESLDPWQIWCSIHSDRMMRASVLEFTEKQASKVGKCYAYFFDWESPVKEFGSCHALEIPFMFGTLGAVRGVKKFAGEGPEADRLSEIMQDVWIKFAKEGDPATQATGPWPCYDYQNRPTMILGKKCGIQNAPCEPERRIWEEVDSEVFINW